MAKKVFRDTTSGFTHVAAAIAAAIGTVFLALKWGGNMEKLIVYLIFGVGMTAAFSASGTYHLVTGPQKLIRVCHIIDHCMIYVLIAGTYTPIVSGAFDGSLKWGYIIGIWVFALVGIIIKAFYTGRFRTLSTIIYMIMGWSIIFAIVPLVKSIESRGAMLLLTGGIFYTVGGVIYALKKPNLCKVFGFHELFHIFVMLGATAHYFMIYFYI
ncbi:MAG: hemolysin III family protein [Eubacteriales bacterium]|jgi:hemolysin III|nr:hemolysin III family protein [Eubacteriales bacterium]